MRNRTYGGVRGRKTKVGEKKKNYFVFLLLDSFYYPVCNVPCRAVKVDANLGNWLLT